MEKIKNIGKKRLTRADLRLKWRYQIPLAPKLIASFLLVIIGGNIVFTIVGITIIGDRIVTEAQERVRTDLNAAREIYLGELSHIYDVVRLTAYRFLLWEKLSVGDIKLVTNELIKVKGNEGLDCLTLTDKSGKVIIRTSNLDVVGDDQSHDKLVKIVLETQRPVSSTVIIKEEDLKKESPFLAEDAHFVFIDTPMARLRPETEERDGMMLKAAAPIYDKNGSFSGVLYGGILLSRNYDIVDKIRDTVFQGIKYKNKDIGTATIFQDDVRISTNVLNNDGTRAVGTRIAEEVYNQVVLKGEPWTWRAYVVNDWYITAYEPIRDIENEIIGILYVGILEQRYIDIRNNMITSFLTISFISALITILFSYSISRSITIPVKKLVLAARELAEGNLDTKVETSSNDEIGSLAKAFNSMAKALKDRDEQLKEYTKKKIMESEKLALIGQLAANVAHELNNPLQGIVTYSYLLLERSPCDEGTKQNLQKIVTQADRCRDIIRGLLDFSRQRKPDKTLCDINNVLQECVSLIENQALFHNVQIHEKLEPNLPKAIIDPSQVKQVFINLIINAAEAMEGTGKLSLKTSHKPNEQCIEIEFTDTGPGISQENLEKIFDPFFTTKETGHGVGLGLAISYGIIKEHNGSIFVQSELGKGTTFLVTFPVASEAIGVKNG